VAIVFDITNRVSFDNIRPWIRDAQKNVDSSKIIIIGNKSDLSHERNVSIEEAEGYVRSVDTIYIEISAKTGDGLEEAYLEMTKLALV